MQVLISEEGRRASTYPAALAPAVSSEQRAARLDRKALLMRCLNRPCGLGLGEPFPARAVTAVRKRLDPAPPRPKLGRIRMVICRPTWSVWPAAGRRWRLYRSRDPVRLCRCPRPREGCHRRGRPPRRRRCRRGRPRTTRGGAGERLLRATGRVLQSQLEHSTDELRDLRRLAGAVARDVERGDPVLVQPRPELSRRLIGRGIGWDRKARPAAGTA